MSLWPRLSMALAVCAPLLLTGVAEGQTSTTVTLFLKNNNEGVVRGPSYFEIDDYIRLNQFNQKNCVDGEIVTFNVDIKGSTAQIGNTHLEAWIGSACDQKNNRISANRTCRKIGEVGRNVERMEIYVRDMVGPLDLSGEEGGTGGTGGSGGTGGTGGSGGTSGTGGSAATDVGGTGGTDTSLGGTGGTDTNVSGTGGTDLSMGGTVGGTDSGLAGTLPTAGTSSLSIIPAAAGGNAATGGDTGSGGTGIFPLAEAAGASSSDENGLEGPESPPGVQPISVCESVVNATPSDRTIYFVLVDTDGNGPNMAQVPPTAKWAYNYDMGGPSPPTGVTAGIGESALVVKWTQAADAPIDLKQYVFFCDPPTGAGTAEGAAGAGGDGSDEDNSIGALCTSSAFTEGQVPSVSVIKKNFCGNVQSTTNQGEAGPLVNGVRYAVAIASRDSYYNVGPISTIVCGTPELVTDFYEAYRKAGGRGGGGFCAIGRVKTHALTTLFFLGALGLIVRRRTRRRSLS